MRAVAGFASIVLAVAVAGAPVAVSAVGFFAEDTPSGAAQPQVQAPNATDTALGNLKISIPSVAAVDSSMDETALRDLFTGKFGERAAQLGTLTAKSITIPQVRITDPRSTELGTIEFHDLSLLDVKNGVAASASLGGVDVTSTEALVKLGRFSVENVDIGRLLAFYGLIPGDGGTSFSTLYSTYEFDGASIVAPTATCSLGKMESGAFEARPLKTSFMQLLTLMQALEATPEQPPSDLLFKIVGFYTDYLRAMKSSPTSLDGINCVGKDPSTSKPFAVSIGSASSGGFAPGIYPQISFKNLNIKADDGQISLDQFTLYPIDLSGPLEALDTAGSSLSPEWFEANYRKIIPALGGFSFSGLDVDVPDEQNSGQRIQARVGSFDLKLSDYKNGIPTVISNVATGIEGTLPADSEDEEVKALIAAGITSVNVGYNVAAHWDAATSAINVDDVSINGVDLGAVGWSVVLGNAGADLFDADIEKAMAAAMQVTVKSSTVKVTDAGFLEIMLARAAAEQHIADLPTARRTFAGVAEGGILAILGATDEARSLGAAVGDFILGTSKTLTVTATAVDPAGLPVALWEAASADPSVLKDKIKVTGAH